MSKENAHKYTLSKNSLYENPSSLTLRSISLPYWHNEVQRKHTTYITRTRTRNTYAWLSKELTVSLNNGDLIKQVWLESPTEEKRKSRNIFPVFSFWRRDSWKLQTRTTAFHQRFRCGSSKVEKKEGGRKENEKKSSREKWLFASNCSSNSERANGAKGRSE